MEKEENRTDPGEKNQEKCLLGLALLRTHLVRSRASFSMALGPGVLTGKRRDIPAHPLGLMVIIILAAFH